MAEIQTIGEFTLHCVNIAFHLERENVYSPWVIIGVYVTHPKFQGCRYLRDRGVGMVEGFDSYLEDCENDFVAGSTQALDIWRKMHVGTLSMITPVIRYWTTNSGEYKDTLRCMYVQYAGSNSVIHFAILAIMLKMRENYYPALFTDLPKLQGVRQAIIQKGIA